MRIVAGSLGGRTLRAPAGPKTRPTSDKVRGAVFNILGQLPHGGAVLDVYAGSGALGLEALSRGAARAVFVDSAPEAVATIKHNATVLEVAALCQIHRGDAMKVLPRLAGPFGIVFLDPPYRLDPTAAILLLPPLLADEHVVVVEHDRRSAPESTIGQLSRHDRRRYGDTEVSFYR